MNKFSFLGLLIILGLSSMGVNAQQPDAPVAITLERQACFGTCPVYTVTILEDGTVIYNGESSVAITDEQTSEIPAETVQAMVEAFENAGYFDWEETYTEQAITDLPTVITSVTRNGETHRVEHYAGDFSAPLVLPFLEIWIDEMTSSSLWTGVQPDPAAISNGTDTPLITLQRQACFGTCPIDSIAMFADGSIVYTGIAHVDQLGVHLLQSDAATVEASAFQAQALGCFDWEDNYEEFALSDQSTVITSIRWEDQSKNIIRYNGDPNAPIGLLWIENGIVGLVTNLLD